MAYPPHLRSTVIVALVVGTVLFCINQLDVVLRGEATSIVWLKSAVTYVVPFAVSNVGVLIASRRPATETQESETPVSRRSWRTPHRRSGP